MSEQDSEKRPPRVSTAGRRGGRRGSTPGLSTPQVNVPRAGFTARRSQSASSQLREERGSFQTIPGGPQGRDRVSIRCEWSFLLAALTFAPMPHTHTQKKTVGNPWRPEHVTPNRMSWRQSCHCRSLVVVGGARGDASFDAGSNAQQRNSDAQTALSEEGEFPAHGAHEAPQHRGTSSPRSDSWWLTDLAVSMRGAREPSVCGPTCTSRLRIRWGWSLGWGPRGGSNFQTTGLIYVQGILPRRTRHRGVIDTIIGFSERRDS